MFAKFLNMSFIHDLFGYGCVSPGTFESSNKWHIAIIDMSVITLDRRAPATGSLHQSK